MNTLYPNAIVVTGGPCCGKTTLVNLAKKNGWPVLPEVARTLIEESKEAGSDMVPWERLADFQAEVAKRQIAQEEILRGSTDCWILDRGLVDGAGYCLAAGIEVPELVTTRAKNRYGLVIVLDPLPVYDSESRSEDCEQARKIHECILDAYAMFGYELLRIPAMSVEERSVYLGEYLVDLAHETTSIKQR